MNKSKENIDELILEVKRYMGCDTVSVVGTQDGLDKIDIDREDVVVNTITLDNQTNK